MKILYIAKHNSGGNDDEGAISYALEALGHEVIKVNERTPGAAVGVTADLCLFHKLPQLEYLRLYNMPKVFWYFDVVEFPDPWLVRRNHSRLQWMRQAIELSDIGFCTDGDWVAKDQTGKLVHLMQGADERYIGHLPQVDPSVQIFFPGTSRGHGSQRHDWFRFMQRTYGPQFVHAEAGVHQEALRKMVTESALVVAPEFPISDRYWSNRVYLISGFGGCLLHPYSIGTAHHYRHLEEIVFYHSRDDLQEKIEHLLARPLERALIREAAYQRTVSEHLYRHRCERLLSVVGERLYA